MQKGFAASAVALLVMGALAGCSMGEDDRFVDVASSAGVTYIVNEGYRTEAGPVTNGMAAMMDSVVGGIAVGDFDNDGWLDFYITDNGPNALYRNLGNGRFEDVTQALKAGDSGNGRSALFIDYDGDGWQDLFIVNHKGPNKLLRNNQGKAFVDVTAAARLGHSTTGYGAAAADVDKDGDLDIVVANYGDLWQDAPEFYSTANDGALKTLYINRGDGRFEEAAVARGITDQGWGFQPAFRDYDEDGDSDLYMCNDFGYDYLYKNQNGMFTRHSQDIGLNSYRNCMGIAWGDYDLDGRVDVFIPNIYVPGTGVPSNDGNFLWMNQGDGRFRDEAIPRGVQDSLWSWGPVAFDADNDMDLDLFVTNGMATTGRYDAWYDATWELIPKGAPLEPAFQGEELARSAYNATHDMVRRMDTRGMENEFKSFAKDQPDRFFENDGSGRFSERAAAQGFTATDDGRSVASVDYDRDGDLDLISTARNKPVHLWQNQGDVGNFLTIWPRGTERMNKDAVGTLVTVHVGGKVLRQERTAGDGFLAQSSPVLHFGLGDESSASEVKVRWPGGATQSFSNVAGGHYRLTQGGQLERL